MISIVIATYNSELTLRRAMQSILNLTYQDWECIVVDGASKDGTLDIVKEFVDRDARFRYISEPDHGIYDAFNKGWKMAKGEWVMYLGSDDEYTPDGIQVLVDNSQDADIVFGDTWIRNLKSGKEQLQSARVTRYGIACCHQSLMMKRNLMESLGGFDEHYRVFADADLMYRAERKKCAIVQVHIPISVFSVGGVSQSFSWKNRWESFCITCKYCSLGHSLYCLIVVSGKLLLIDILRKIGLKS